MTKISSSRSRAERVRREQGQTPVGEYQLSVEIRRNNKKRLTASTNSDGRTGTRSVSEPSPDNRGVGEWG